MRIYVQLFQRLRLEGAPQSRLGLAERGLSFRLVGGLEDSPKVLIEP